MSQITPGPWVVREVKGVGLPGQVGYAIDFNADQEQVVDYVYEKADAHLIAAAPELLECLRGLEECYCELGQRLGKDDRQRHRETLIRARAALAKALGQ